MAYFLIMSTVMVLSSVIFMLLCTVNWLDVEGLNNEVGRSTSEVGPAQPLTLTTGCSKNKLF